MKRTVDFLLVFVTSPMWLPLLGVTALLVLWQHGSPVLFRQNRPGLRGKPLAILKFRTMTNARDAQGNLLPDAQRLTSLAAGVRAFEEQLQRAWH